MANPRFSGKLAAACTANNKGSQKQWFNMVRCMVLVVAVFGASDSGAVYSRASLSYLSTAVVLLYSSLAGSDHVIIYDRWYYSALLYCMKYSLFGGDVRGQHSFRLYTYCTYLFLNTILNLFPTGYFTAKSMLATVLIIVGRYYYNTIVYIWSTIGRLLGG